MSSEFISNINRFRAAAQSCPDLSKHEDEAVRAQYNPDDFEGPVPAGLVYPGSLVIEDWSHSPQVLDGNRYYLVIGNCEWVSNDLAPLEDELFDYYLVECVN